MQCNAAQEESAMEQTNRQVGPETRAVRIFREVFAQDAQVAKHLQPSLDRYLKLVLEDPDAKRGDKTYARKIYADLSRQFNGEAKALPDWAKKQEDPLITDQELQEILSAAQTSPAAVTLTSSTAHTVTPASVTIAVTAPPAPVGMDIDPLDDLLSLSPEPERHVLQAQCQQYLNELLLGAKMPFIRVFTANVPASQDTQLRQGPLAGISRYVALGTVLGTVTHGKYEGKKINVHCTVAGFRRLRDAEAQHVVHLGGQPLVVSTDDPRSGLRKYIFCLRHTPGLKIRYWTRMDDRDVYDNARFFVLTGDDVRPLTREQF